MPSPKGGGVKREAKRNMNLQEFVARSIDQISKGVADAANTTRGARALVNPRGFEGAGEEYRGYYEDSEGVQHPIEYIEFDVAVIAEESSGKTGNGDIKVFSIGVGGGIANNSTNRSESRIKFRVPIVFPTTEGKVR